MYAIIPDLHADKVCLDKTLLACGFIQTKPFSWRHPKGFKAVFLGDFIDYSRDRSDPNCDDKYVVETVKNMVQVGDAYAIMGNHELNALMYHTSTICEKTGKHKWLRDRSEDNKRQHHSFLEAHNVNFDDDYSSPKDPELKETLDWFLTLPLFIDFGEFRVVHAQWDDNCISLIKSCFPDNTIDHSKQASLADIHQGIGKAVERTRSSLAKFSLKCTAMSYAINSIRLWAP
jgi:hypothetical protein